MTANKQWTALMQKRHAERRARGAAHNAAWEARIRTHEVLRRIEDRLWRRAVHLSRQLKRAPTYAEIEELLRDQLGLSPERRAEQLADILSMFEN